MNNEIFEPLKHYNGELKDKHRKLTEEYFDNLLKVSGAHLGVE